MNQTPSSVTIRPVLIAWALGAFEAGLVLSSIAHFFTTPMAFVMAVLTPMIVYGWGGWLLGRVVALDRRLPRRAAMVWLLLYLLGLPVLLYLRRFLYFGTDGWSWVVGGCLLSLSLVALSWRPGPRRAIWIRRALAFSLVVPFLGLAYLRTTQPQPLEGPAPQRAAAAGAPNLVLVTWDTTRADTLPLFGGGGLDTPALDSLAAKGVVFDHYHTIAPITGPAHNSMLTGLYPPSHGLRTNGDLVQPLNTPRLPALLREAGYATAAFVSALPVRRDFHFQSGFQYFDDRPRITASSPLIEMLGFVVRTCVLGDRLLPKGLDFATYTTPGDVTADRAIAWLDAQPKDRPVFLWVHFFDAHDPRDTTGPYAEFSAAALARKDEGPHAVNPECEESLVLQRGEIAFVDHQFGRLMAALSRRDPGLERTAVVVVADHGECFGEGQEVPELFGEGGIKVLHVPSLYEATQHVVCVIEPPAALRGAAIGRRNHSPASHLDLYPTLAMLAGQSIPSGLQGRSLLPALRGEELPDRPLYMEAFGATNQDQRDDRLQAILEGGWKYVRTVDRRMEFLYSLADGDAVDHAKDQPERLARMREKLEELFRGLEEVHSVSAATTAPGLGALGYVGGDDEDR